MKDEIIIPVLKEEDTIAANLRRDNYSLKRDKQAREFNDAIASRFISDTVSNVKCEKCGKEFSAATSEEVRGSCPDCS